MGYEEGAPVYLPVQNGLEKVNGRRESHQDSPGKVRAEGWVEGPIRVAGVNGNLAILARNGGGAGWHAGPCSSRRGVEGGWRRGRHGG